MIKGSHHTKETKEKLRQINLGKHHSEATKRKISKLMKGRRITWADKISKSLTGRKLSKKERKKLSEAHKGIKPSEETRKKMSLAHSGKKLTKEHRERLSKIAKETNRRPPHCYGKECWNWKGGITPLNIKIRSSRKMKAWRRAVLAKYGAVCQKCNQQKGQMISHHIFSFAKYPGIRADVNNGIVLCKDCHDKFHKIYGNKHNTRQQLEEFLS